MLLSFIIFPFIAGFIDAVVGGGGLIQIPMLLINFPNTNLATLFGTNKIAALAGTSVAAVQFSRKIKFNYILLITISAFAFIASFFGARLVSYVDSKQLKPVILFILILIAVYTFIKKDLGKFQSKNLSLRKQLLWGSILGLVVGFYDGFFGPGTGSFFVLGFVVILGFEFIQASAYTKIINCITNISALIVFIKNGNYLIELAILMAVCNMAGNFLGTRMAFKKGNSFVRKIFLLIVSLMICRYGYDVFFNT
ncbi:MAG: TSUP family transporter [Sphingobacteriaceae bacterium]|nr:TSUP family transporter [Sphingobacteriaceae bacterium]